MPWVLPRKGAHKLPTGAPLTGEPAASSLCQPTHFNRAGAMVVAPICPSPLPLLPCSPQLHRQLFAVLTNNFS